jgi:hypothetical protein
MHMRSSLLGLVGGILLLLPSCRSQLPFATPGALVRRTPVEAVPCADVATLRWCCGPRNDKPLCRRFRVEIEGGPVWQTRNDAAIPGDTGTRFPLDEVTGAGPFPYGRITLDYMIAPRHSVRALVAPLEIKKSGRLDRDVSFDGRDFAAGALTRGTFKFNSYRLGYRYLLACGPTWALHVGATAKIRDAKIELEQGAVRGRKTDLGFVPLLHIDFEKRLSQRWRFSADLDGAAAPQGRAFDLALKLYYDLDDRTSVGFGYRTIEGGADNDTAYTFTWLHQALLSLEYRF